MTDDTIDFELPSENPQEVPRECHMSLSLYQNARQTMGELRDFLRASGISWKELEAQIQRTSAPSSPIEKALDSLDEYSTGLARSLHDKPSNIH